MQQQYHIRASCVIDRNSIYKGKKCLYNDNSGVDASGFLLNAYRSLKINYPRFYKMDNLCKLGWLCTELLVTGNNGESEDLPGGIIPEIPPESVCVLLCNANSSLDTDQKYYQTVSQMASPALFVYTLPNIVIGEICIRNGWKGENLFFILEAFDAGFLKTQVELAMKDEQNRACICGWVELLGNEYKAALYVVEHSNGSQYPNFTTENILSSWEREA